MLRFIVWSVVIGAATAAHARPFEAYECGKYEVQYLPGKYFAPGPECHEERCDHRDHYVVKKAEKQHIIDREIKQKGDDLFYKRRKCRFIPYD